jgi:putative FmdB family regulatory protein
MPMFDFKCEKCGQEQEFMVKDGEQIVLCECGGEFSKVFRKVSFSLSGACWAKDGYRSSMENTICKDKNNWQRS